MNDREVGFGERLERWLKVLGMKQSTFARAVEVKPPTVHGWLSGQEAPRIDRLPAIAAALNITLAEFFGDLPKLGATRPAEPLPEAELGPHPGTGDVTRELDASAFTGSFDADGTCPNCGGHRGEAA